MISILQNVTKDNVLLQLKRIAIGIAIASPLVGIALLVTYLAASGYINGFAIFVGFQTIAAIFVLWTLGGAYESYKNMKQVQKDHQERETLRAFRKLGNGNT